MPAAELLRDGKLEEALAELQKQVRGAPSDPKLRVFLFQLLAVNGEWDRSLTQLNVAGEMDPGTLAMVQTYREALRCEVLRAAVLRGERSPLIFGDPEQWVALLIEAGKLVAQGEYRRAQGLRDQAFEAAPATSGTLKTAGAGEDAPAAFEWIADADGRFGPVLEAVINGRYYWIPFHRIARVEIEEPTDLRDIVWTPAHLAFANGGETVGLIPTRYPGSEDSEDSLIRLARKTEWIELDPETFLGRGQRLLATDQGEHPLMDIRQIVLEVAPETEGTASPDSGSA
jgi:type VI secretion system protein ImpE